MNHVCIGVLCPSVVETRDGYVCTETGVCVGSQMMVSQDPADGTQLLGNAHGKAPPATFVAISDHDKNGCKMEMVAKNSKRRENDRGYYATMHTCRTVVQKILKSEARDDFARVVKAKAETLALKAMIAYVKRRRELKLDFSFGRALNIGLSVYVLRAGRYEYPSVSDEFVNHVVARVGRMCLHFSNDNANNTKMQYRCLCVLYMLKTDVFVRGRIFALKEKRLQRILPGGAARARTRRFVNPEGPRLGRRRGKLDENAPIA